MEAILNAIQDVDWIPLEPPVYRSQEPYPRCQAEFELDGFDVVAFRMSDGLIRLSFDPYSIIRRELTTLR